MLRMGKAPLSWIAAFYINVFRGMPALVTVIWIYFGVSLLLGVNFTVFQAGVLALSLLYSAFMAEIFRSALAGGPARAPRGRPGARHARRPHLLLGGRCRRRSRSRCPNIGSMFIGMIKDTSTFTVIGLLEVVRVTQNINAQTFQPFVLYTAAAGIYVLAAFAVDLIFRLIEGSLSRPRPRAWSRGCSVVAQRRIEVVR